MRKTLSLPAKRSTFWLVWKVGSNKINKRHSTAQDAEREAQRLSALYPDRTFYVLEAKQRIGSPE